MSSETLADLDQRARQAMMQRRPREARALLERAVGLAPDEWALLLNLAAACRMDGDDAAALAALETLLARRPLEFLALLMKARLLEAKGDAGAAHAYAAALLQAPPPEQLDAATRAALDHGRALARDHQARIEATLQQALDSSDRRSGTEQAARMQRFIEHLAGKRRIFHSQPALFHYPGLPSIEFYERELFPWLPELEAQTAVIQQELAAVLADRDHAGLEPYIQIPDGQPVEQWAELDRSPRWSAYHFSFYGEDYAEHRRQCPRTAAILDALPQPRIERRSPAALFSILEPHTHIPPHHGAANTRLLCHLPLILPPDCRLRVGNEIRAWQIGQAMIFDDSIEHEAWNDSDQIRVVLIFDIWNPYLSAAERDLVVRCLQSLDRINGVAPGTSAS